MFLSPDDFAVEGSRYLIPNILNEDGPDYTDFIDETEEEILRQIFGDELYEQFILGLADVSPAQKWIDLRDGDVFTYQSKQYNYKGLVYVLQPYVYSEWIKDNFDNLARLGVNMPDLENGEPISPATRIVRAYNEFVDRLGCESIQRSTLYGFLQSNKEVSYPSWVFDEDEEIEAINIWNL